MAVDFPKTSIPVNIPRHLKINGAYPDFMGKKEQISYDSKKVLGQMFRKVSEIPKVPILQYLFATNTTAKTTITSVTTTTTTTAMTTTTKTSLPSSLPVNVTLDSSMLVSGVQKSKFINEAVKLRDAYNLAVFGLMNKFGIKTEVEVYSGGVLKTHWQFKKKESRWSAKESIKEEMKVIKRNLEYDFWKEYDGVWQIAIHNSNTKQKNQELDLSLKEKASVWYYVTYCEQYSTSPRLLSFPWINVDILCSIRRGVEVNLLTSVPSWLTNSIIK